MVFALPGAGVWLTIINKLRASTACRAGSQRCRLSPPRGHADGKSPSQAAHVYERTARNILAAARKKARCALVTCALARLLHLRVSRWRSASVEYRPDQAVMLGSLLMIVTTSGASVSKYHRMMNDQRI